MLPQGAGEQLTAHVTPFPLESLVKVATIFGTVPVASTVAVAGVTETATDGTVMDTVADLVESVTEVAVTITTKSLTGVVLGAL
ncbi:MAG: hypothetical protein JOZ80_20465 [Acidobacteriaceae bacterium]|nr:hypothetical protein [Acidobacteriaceae bacterium]